MEVGLENVELVLQPNQPVRIGNGKGVTIRCLSGVVWLTAEGESEDVFLSAGKSRFLNRSGLTLLEATIPARVSLESASVREPKHAYKLLSDRRG